MLYFKEIRDGDVNRRAGIVVTDGAAVLGCLPTPSRKYPNFERLLDLPKGHMQQGETPLEAAIRECWEETNLKFSEKDLVFAGEFSVYDAPLYLFRAKVYQLPKTTELSCPSTFKNKGGIADLPENYDYEIVPIEKIPERFFPELVKAIQQSL